MGYINNMKKKSISRPRVMLPRNLVVTQVAPSKRGRGAYNRQVFKRQLES